MCMETGVCVVTTTTILTHFSTHLEIYNLFKKKLILKSLKGYQLPEITKKLKMSGSWFK